MDESIGVVIEAWIRAETEYKKAVKASSAKNFENEFLEEEVKVWAIKCQGFRRAVICLVDHFAELNVQ